MAILVNRERLDPIITTQATTQMVNDNTLVSEAEINSEAELLKSSDVLRQVVEANKLQGQPRHSLLDLFHRKLSDSDRVEAATHSLAKDLKIEVLPKTNMIEVTYSSSDPQQSYSVLKSLGDLYLEKQMKVHRAAGSYEFFQGETLKSQKALETAENRLKAFQKTGAAAPELERGDLAQQLSNAVGQAHAAEEAIAADERKMESDRSQMKVTPERSATEQDVNAPSVLLEQLHATLLAAQTKRCRLERDQVRSELSLGAGSRPRGCSRKGSHYRGGEQAVHQSTNRSRSDLRAAARGSRQDRNRSCCPGRVAGPGQKDHSESSGADHRSGPASH